MSAVLGATQDAGGAGEVASRLAFFKNLQTVTNKIHATANIDEIMLELSQDICTLFNADRLTIYSVSEDKSSIVSKVKTGLNSFKDLRLPIADQSIAGFVALSKKLANIRDVYDEAELKSHTPSLRFLQEVDKRTGYRTKQMLVAPITDAHSGELLGVVQLINNKAGAPFSQVAEEGVKGLCETLAIAFTQRQKPAHVVKSSTTTWSPTPCSPRPNSTWRRARPGARASTSRKSSSTNFRSSRRRIGAACPSFSACPTSPSSPIAHQADGPAEEPQARIRRGKPVVPIEETKEGVVILTMDPEQVKSSRIVNNVFPKNKLVFRVTTIGEFRQTLDQFYGATADYGSVGDLLSGLDEGEEGGTELSSEDLSAAADNELVKLVNKVIIDAYSQGASDIHIEPRPGKDKTLIRFRKDGSLVNYIEIPSSYRNALVARLKIMCDLDISERRKPQDGKIKFKKFGPLDIELRVATIPSAGGVEDVVMRILAAGEPIPLEKARHPAAQPGKAEKRHREALRPVLRLRPDRLGQDHHAAFGAEAPQHPGHQDLDRRGPGRNHAEGPAPGADQPQGRPRLRHHHARLPARRPGHHHGRRDARQGDRLHRHRGLAHRPPGVRHPAHQQRAESITRLLDMGMDPFNFADALLGILAQRLGKRLCGECKEAYAPSPEEMKSLLTEYCEELLNTAAFKKDAKAGYEAVYKEWAKTYADDKGQFKLYRAKGCEKCNGSGYKGRVGLHELMVGTDGAKKLIQEHARVADLVACALEDGMRTLKQDGIEKVLQGITDIKQVRAVCIK
jgi:type II secretory ATPase GspE/PulE/Tfp pilus assembly ATPase PilB-like protein